MVWSVTSKQNLRKLESVQRRATSYILNAPQNESYKSRLQKCKLLPLSYRREISDLYKSINGHLALSHQTLFPARNPRRSLRTSVDNTHFNISRCNTETFRHSYVNRVKYLWNNLALNVKKSTSLAIFKKRLTSHYTNLFINSFNTDNICSWVSRCTCVSCRP